MILTYSPGAYPVALHSLALDLSGTYSWLILRGKLQAMGGLSTGLLAAVARCGVGTLSVDSPPGLASCELMTSRRGPPRL